MERMRRLVSGRADVERKLFRTVQVISRQLNDESLVRMLNARPAQLCELSCEDKTRGSRYERDETSDPHNRCTIDHQI